MQYDEFLELVKNRRSIRHYKADPVSDEDIEKIIEAARWAPSGFNSQLWEFVVVKDPALREQIIAFVVEAYKTMFKKTAPPKKDGVDPGRKFVMGWQKAPVFIIPFGDTRVRDCSPVPPVKTDDIKWNSVFYSSMAIAYQYVALAAVSLGLGSQWVSAVCAPPVEARIKELLGIPAAMKVYDMLTLGYPAKEPLAKKMRPLKEMIHYDACGEADFRTKEQVRAYFGIKR
jgi:nitroreductase